MGIRYIHLLRHGQYHMDKEHPKRGSLTSLGRYQAQRAAKRLRDYNITSIHVSTMTRAKETADLVLESFANTKSRKCKLLIEGIPEFPEYLIKKNKLKKAKLKETKTRMNKAFKKYFKPHRGQGNRHDALICHGNVIRYLVTKALGVDTAAWIRFDIYQCSLTTVSIDNKGKMRLIIYGEVGHIPAKKRTYT